MGHKLILLSKPSVVLRFWEQTKRAHLPADFHPWNCCQRKPTVTPPCYHQWQSQGSCYDRSCTLLQNDNSCRTLLHIVDNFCIFATCSSFVSVNFSWSGIRPAWRAFIALIHQYLTVYLALGSDEPHRTLALSCCFFLVHFSFHTHFWFLTTVQSCSETGGVITEMSKLTLFLWPQPYNKTVMKCAIFVQICLYSAGYAKLCSIYFLFILSKVARLKLDLNCPAGCSTYLSMVKTKSSCFQKLLKQ